MVALPLLVATNDNPRLWLFYKFYICPFSLIYCDSNEKVYLISNSWILISCPQNTFISKIIVFPLISWAVKRYKARIIDK
jgi:hypothetical protein